MGNSATSKIKGSRSVILKITSKKEATLKNVFYVPNVRKNLVYESFLSTHGFRMFLN